MTPVRAHIAGVGHAVPPRVVTNAALTAFMDTSDEWIQQRSGIRERRWYRDGSREFTGEGSAALATAAALRAMESAGVPPEEIGALIYVTISPDNEFPGSGGTVLAALGVPLTAPVYEVRNHCSGFLYGILIGRTLIESGGPAHVLVIGVEVQSSGLNLSTVGRNTAVLFGDGCGAVVLSAGASPRGIRQIMLESDGAFAGKLGVTCPSFARPGPIVPGDYEGESPGAFPHMDGQLIFKLASTRMPEMVRRITAGSGVELSELALIVPHQANQRILDMLGRELGCPEKIFSNIERYGNTTGASIPLALSEAVAAGRVRSGDTICLVSFGAGFSWGAALIRW